jgi:type III secretion protein Q
MECEEPVNACHAFSVLDADAVPLSRSPLLPQTSQQMLELSKLYGRSAADRHIGETSWCFRWVHLTAPLAGVELRLRIGGAQLSIGIDDLRPFGSAADVVRTEFPADLRTAYLIECGAALWDELEKLTRRTVELTDVRPCSALEITPDCLGFEVEDESRHVVARGCVRPLDPGAQPILIEASRRVMPAANVRPETYIRWTAVVGSTRLASSEVRALEAHDIVVIEDAVYSAEALECWLGAGPTRRFAGRVSLRTGQMQLVDFTLKGNALMSSLDADGPPASLSGFEEIPVGLRFEVAQWQASLGEVAALAPGAIIDLGHRVDAQAVTVWVEQRCIGTGQLVAIGERLGVRLVNVFSGTTGQDA